MKKPPLNELMTMMQSGDALALDELFTELRPRLSSFASKCVEPSEVDDVVQETLFLVWKRCESYDSTRGNVLAWSKRIALNIATDMHKKKSRMRRGGGFQQIDVCLIHLPTRAGESLNTERYQSELLLQIDQLPRELRVAFKASIGGKSLRSIATTLGCSVTRITRLLTIATSILSTSPDLIDAVEMGMAV